MDHSARFLHALSEEQKVVTTVLCKGILKIANQSMKRVAILVIVLGLILGGIYTYKTKTSIEVYVAPEKEIMKETIEVEVLDKRINAALEEAEMETEAKAYKAYTEKRTQLEKEIILEETRAYRKEIEQMESNLEKEISL